jgi:tetratricopeptide (TPR) repeat protein
MPGRQSSLLRGFLFAVPLSAAIFSCTPTLLAQSGPIQKIPAPSPLPNLATNEFTMVKPPTGFAFLKVRVLDLRGLPFENPAEVHIFSKPDAADWTASTLEGAIASFPKVPTGDYSLEVSSAGYQTTTQRLHISNHGGEISVFVYVHPVTETAFTPSAPTVAPALKPEVQHEINKIVEFQQRKDFEKADQQFARANRASPGNADLWYLEGETELGLNKTQAAKEDFERALTLDPKHERSLLALSRIQLDAGDTTAAIASLEKAYRTDGAGWQTLFMLASAHAKVNELPEAEQYAARAVSYAGYYAAPAMMLLADVQYREGKTADARQTWQRLPERFPKSAEAQQASLLLAKFSPESPTGNAAANVGDLPLPMLPGVGGSNAWAPGDVDSKDYPTARGISCNADEVLDQAERRLNAQLLNFEKFTATEHVVHQEVERTGVVDDTKEKTFSYIVFVLPYAGNSLYLEESRDGGSGFSAFPTQMVTTGINSLGVALLQPVNREGFVFTCEGLASIDGQAAWQLRFEEKRDGKSSIRRWRTNKATYNVREKGRVWLSSTTFDMMQIETDLLEPIRELALTRDHLEVNYGPVNFQGGKQWLWLPLHADMYMEYRGRRYHHRHYLSDYMLFGVDDMQKIGAPKLPPPSADPDH